MDNLKVQVNNEAESKEVQELFFELGGVWANCGKTYNDMIQIGDYIFFTDCNMLNYGLGLGREEITTQQLRDLVILKRNDVDDATHENNSGQKMYEAISGDWYLYFNNKWKIDGVDIDDMPKPIEKEMKMKEYLNPLKAGGYELSNDALCNDSIEVPEWANYAYKNDMGVCFLKDAIGYNHPMLIWQRETLNDKVASAEAARQGIKFDNNKPRYSLLPKGAVNAVIDVLEFGAKKYEADNWQKVDNAKERYYNAAMRHIDKWWNGEKHDPETNIHHLAHASTNLFFLMWFDK